MMKKTGKKKTKIRAAKETRCTGHCCEDFTLAYGPEQMKGLYMAWRRRGQVELQLGASDEAKPVGIVQDIHLIYPMLIYLGQYKNARCDFVNPPDTTMTHHYTCKHYNAKTGNCSIYDIRPAMCREYPYTQSCNYVECTWQERKAKLEPPKTKQKSDVRKQSLAVIQD